MLVQVESMQNNQTVINWSDNQPDSAVNGNWQNHAIVIVHMLTQKIHPARAEAIRLASGIV